MREARTAEAVGRRLVASFAALPGRPVYSRGGRFEGADESFAWGDLFRGRGRLGWLCLLTWARAAAVPGSPTAAEFCREYGIARSSFERRRRAAAAAIAASIEGAPRGHARRPPSPGGRRRRTALDSGKASLAA